MLKYFSIGLIFIFANLNCDIDNKQNDWEAFLLHFYKCYSNQETEESLCYVEISAKNNMYSLQKMDSNHLRFDQTAIENTLSCLNNKFEPDSECEFKFIIVRAPIGIQKDSLKLKIDNFKTLRNIPNNVKLVSSYFNSREGLIPK